MAQSLENTLAPHLRGQNPDYTRVDEGSDGTEGYVGVSPEYQNAANPTDEPHSAEGDQVSELVEAGVNNQWELSQGDDEDAEGDEGGERSETPKPGRKTQSKTPPKDES